jgi:CheY-like chemotaxis protein
MPTRRFLLIDDHQEVRQTFAALLQALGHTVVEAEGGPAGLCRLAEESVDVVLTDLEMPGMTGWEVARAVKARDPSLPVILLTGWGDEPPGGTEARVAVDRILCKPARMQDVLSAITSLPDPSEREERI